MGKLTTTATVIAAVVGIAGGAVFAQPDSPAGRIEAALQSYETALNASDTAAIVPLYQANGVFMPPNVPAQIGADALRAAYDGVFAALSFQLEFEIDEIVVVSPDWAFARTRSAGTAVLKATGATLPQANQELFIFARDAGGAWRIARYAFNTTLPAN